MKEFQTLPKKQDSSAGIQLPKDVIKQEPVNPERKVTLLVSGVHNKKPKTIYGTLRLKKKTQQVMD